MPESALNVVADYGAHADGFTNDADHVQAAVTALGTAGGDIYFPPGSYALTTSIKLPPSNAATMTFWGYGAKVILSGSTSFLEFADTTNWQAFRYFTVKGFEVDAAARWAGSSGYVITAFNAFGNYFVKRGDVEYITLADLNIHGAPSLGSGGTACAIALGCKQGGIVGSTSSVDGVTENTMQYVRHINIDNVTISGGDTGILVNTECKVEGLPGSIPADFNMTVDDVNISNVWFDSGRRPPYGTTYMHTGIQIGVWGRGGTCTVSDCYLRGSYDNLLEIDNMQVANVSRVACIENRNHAFTLTRFGYPADAVAGVDEGSMTVAYTDCYYDKGDTGVGLGWGFDYDEVLNHTAHPTYHVTYSNCYTINADNSTTAYTGP
jgi:hypothetical protein